MERVLACSLGGSQSEMEERGQHPHTGPHHSHWHVSHHTVFSPPTTPPLFLLPEQIVLVTESSNVTCDSRGTTGRTGGGDDFRPFLFLYISISAFDCLCWLDEVTVRAGSHESTTNQNNCNNHNCVNKEHSQMEAFAWVSRSLSVSNTIENERWRLKKKTVHSNLSSMFIFRMDGIKK